MLLVETPEVAAAGDIMPANAATRTAQIAIAVTAKNTDSPERFLRFIMVVSLSGFRAGGNRLLDGDHFRLAFVRPRRRLTQGFCAKCTFRSPGRRLVPMRGRRPAPHQCEGSFLLTVMCLASTEM